MRFCPKTGRWLKKTPEDGGILLPMCRPNPVGAVGPLAAPFNGPAIIVWHGFIEAVFKKCNWIAFDFWI